MRIGSHPQKDRVLKYSATHRIIIPVYVPNQEGYFKEGLKITQLCIESVLYSIHQKTLVTLVNNGCCKVVTDYLQGLYESGKIDQLVHFKDNQGKIDAMMSVARSCEESLITLSDGDVLFKKGWIEAVETVFNTFPEAGMVSPVPHGTTYANYTVNTLFDSFFKGILKFQSVCDPQDMLQFAKSIGKEDTMYKNKWRLHHQLTVKRNEVSAVVGCGHFVATLRKEVITKIPSSKSNWAYATQADRQYIDIPNEESGFWRLATAKNLAFHMGNVSEAWMQDQAPKPNSKPSAGVPISKPLRNSIPYGFKKFVVNRLWLNKYMRPYFFKKLGLKEGFNEY